MYYFLFENESEKLAELLPAESKILSDTGLGSCIGVLDDDQNLSGYCVLFPSWTHSKRLCIHDIKVAKDDRRQGVGSELLVQAAKLALSHGAEELGVYVDVSEEDPGEFQQFMDAQDFQISGENLTELTYDLNELKECKIMKIAAQNKDAFLEVKAIENPELDIIKRFYEKAKKQNYYFERLSYDPMLTMFCVKENDVIGSMSLEMLANGNMRICNTFIDKNSKEALIIPSMIITAIELTLTYFGDNLEFEIFVHNAKNVEKLIDILGTPKKNNSLAFYSKKM